MVEKRKLSMMIHHYGLATKNIEKSMEAFQRLGYKVGNVIIDDMQKVKVCFVTPSSPGPLIELVCDLDENGPTNQIINKVGTTFYHMCFEVEQMEQAIKDFRGKEYSLRRPPVAAAAFSGRRIAWMYHFHVGLVELLERT
jgi:methylmalonyl-CoA/ethylmalonyl-CoA epimerase